jgi:hypothetical protein
MNSEVGPGRMQPFCPLEGQENTTNNVTKNHKAGLVGPAFLFVELVRSGLVLTVDPGCQDVKMSTPKISGTFSHRCDFWPTVHGF